MMRTHHCDGPADPCTNAQPWPSCALSARSSEGREGLVARACHFVTLVAEGGVVVLGLPVWAKLYAALPPTESTRRTDVRQMRRGKAPGGTCLLYTSDAADE